jgi:hypothetical protein
MKSGPFAPVLMGGWFMKTHYINCGIHYRRTHADSSYSPPHGITNYIGTKAQGRRQKKLTCKGTSSGVYHNLYVEDTFSHVVILTHRLLVSPYNLQLPKT